MNAGNTDVVEVLDLVAHHFGRDDSLFGNRNVTGSRRDNRDNSPAVFGRIFLQDDCARKLPILHSPYLLLHRGKLPVVGARGQNIPAMSCQARENASHLRSRLSLAENDFRHSIAERAMMINLGESQIFEWKVTQAINRIVGRERASADLLKEVSYGLGVQGVFNWPAAMGKLRLPPASGAGR